MFRTFSIITLATAALLGFGSAFAQSDKYVEGEITRLNLNSGVGTLTIRESATSAIRTFEVTDDTKFTVKGSTSTSLAPRYVDGEPGDLNVGDEVKLDVKTEVDGRETLIAYERVEPNIRVAQTDTRTNRDNQTTTSNRNASSSSNYGYDRLPDTATPLPLIALIGAIALTFAGALRLARKRP